MISPLHNNFVFRQISDPRHPTPDTRLLEHHP
jgi:hypothetical protein